MKTITSVAVAALLLGLAACSPAAETKADAAPAGAVSLIEKPKLSEDIEALPRLAAEGPGIMRINAEFDRRDAAAVSEAGECASMAQENANGGGGWSRSITRPMTGPAYLTVREHLELYCGGAYPSTAQTAITYDVSTGERVDWAKALPGLSLTTPAFEDMPQDYVPLVQSAALGAWYSARMLAVPDAEWVAQCREVFDPAALAEQTFNIWADAENGGVTVAPDFAHVAQACADSATLTAADLSQFNADPKLAEAIAAAHAAGNWGPKEEAEAAAE